MHSSYRDIIEQFYKKYEDMFVKYFIISEDKVRFETHDGWFTEHQFLNALELKISLEEGLEFNIDRKKTIKQRIIEFFGEGLCCVFDGDKFWVVVNDGIHRIYSFYVSKDINRHDLIKLLGAQQARNQVNYYSGYTHYKEL